MNQLTVLHLYPRDMNIYGDNGNLQVLTRRIEEHGYTPVVIAHNQDSPTPDMHNIDIILGGGGQDSGQLRITENLLEIGPSLKKAVEDGMPTLVICGLYQLFGESFTTHTGDVLQGIGVFKLKTIGGSERLVGNITLESDTFGTLVGYENHSGQTFLDSSMTPLGTVTLGAGNNIQDGTEGILYKNAIGSYMHGPLLPKNPIIADYLISTAAKRRYGGFTGKTIDDTLALRAKESALSRPR